MLLTLVLYLEVLVVVLLAVSFYTLFERKLMGSSHLRLGPDHVGWLGLLQPFSDGMKLFSKTWVVLSKSNHSFYTICPAMALWLSLLSWVVVPWPSLVFSSKLLLLLFFIISIASVYVHLGSGWASNSTYAMIGSLRSIAQSISYDVSMLFQFMVIIILMGGLSGVEYIGGQWLVNNWVLCPWLMLMWGMTSLAESNRSPFDFAEGESELVSGFNVEYGSGLFAFLFMGEYSMMILLSGLMALFWFGGLFAFSLFMLVLILMGMFIVARVSFPRSR